MCLVRLDGTITFRFLSGCHSCLSATSLTQKIVHKFHIWLKCYHRKQCLIYFWLVVTFNVESIICTWCRYTEAATKILIPWSRLLIVTRWVTGTNVWAYGWVFGQDRTKISTFHTWHCIHFKLTSVHTRFCWSIILFYLFVFFCLR